MTFNRIPAACRFLSVLVLMLLSAACAATGRDEGGGSLRVVATTTFVGDVVDEIGGERVDMTVLLSPGANPHSYQPTPRDIAGVTRADVVFVNGLGLELFVEDLIANAGGEAQVVHVSRGVEPRTFAGPSPEMEEKSGDHDHEENSPDPHVWLNPLNVVVWTENIEGALVALDPAGAEVYRENGQAYREELQSLDRWIQSQVERIPPEDRELVTDHLVFGYFADRYGFELVGAVVPAPTTEAQPSGQQLAQLQDLIQEYDVQAIFVGRDFDPSLAERMAEDAGIRLVPLYFGSLTAADGPAGTYLEYMRTNVRAIVEALGNP